MCALVSDDSTRLTSSSDLHPRPSCSFHVSASHTYGLFDVREIPHPLPPAAHFLFHRHLFSPVTFFWAGWMALVVMFDSLIHQFRSSCFPGVHRYSRDMGALNLPDGFPEDALYIVRPPTRCPSRGSDSQMKDDANSPLVHFSFCSRFRLRRLDDHFRRSCSASGHGSSSPPGSTSSARKVLPPYVLPIAT